jgi:hypothetical protein
VCPFCNTATDFAKKSAYCQPCGGGEAGPSRRTGPGSLYIETLKPVLAVHVHGAVLEEVAMATDIGRVTIWSIIAVVAIVIVALVLANR